MTGKAPTADGTRLPTLTGRRFIAALMVFLGHAAAQHLFADTGVDKAYGKVVEGAGYVGVSFFWWRSRDARPGSRPRSRPR
ncbi:peptidoglycan/LPS O-acetylase OafA/YrhL [Streptomyces turgidiscabies]|uniref:Peptidoglycan/LPS O-acetylase OafA/YrhL n=1 Tax=Streptomyces turgidiscabies TaxID=85558 RepID=A0ABU0RXQ0_9ACTN|nr:peptidoglycan/LPS O-acetylase OafA/YrhL [Streptomyces turgidiscabies]